MADGCLNEVYDVELNSSHLVYVIQNTRSRKILDDFLKCHFGQKYQNFYKFWHEKLLFRWTTFQYGEEYFLAIFTIIDFSQTLRHH